MKALWVITGILLFGSIAIMIGCGIALVWSGQLTLISNIFLTALILFGTGVFMGMILSYSEE